MPQNLPELSFVVCTHNPRQDYLRATLESIRDQELTTLKAETILVDNASDTPAKDWTAEHFQFVRTVCEPELGLTQARVAGIRSARGQYLIFVDDDNILDPDYAKAAISIFNSFPQMGAIGGRIIPEFEEEPPEWTRPYWWRLAIRDFEQDQWSNFKSAYEKAPWGAGMCIRKSIADGYAERVCTDPLRTELGRKGNNLSSGEDFDMAYTAVDHGYGTGLFKALRLRHLMPRSRLAEDYLLRLTEATETSYRIVEALAGRLHPPEPKPKLIDRIRLRRLEAALPARERAFLKAVERGRLRYERDYYPIFAKRRNEN